MNNLIGVLKTSLIALIILGLLKVTGLMGDVSFIIQTVAMKAGILDVSPVSESKANPKFDYAFTVKDLKGNKISFDQYKGKVVFLNLWATWCGPCKAEMPGIHNLYVKMKGEPVEFVMLSIDKDKALSKVESYVKNNSYTFPVFMPSGYLAEQLQVPSIPTTFVISKDGKIVMKEVGTRNYDTKKMMEFLKQQAAK